MFYDGYILVLKDDTLDIIWIHLILSFTLLSWVESVTEYLERPNTGGVSCGCELWGLDHLAVLQHWQAILSDLHFCACTSPRIGGKNTGYQSDSGLNTCNLSHQPIELPEATTEVEKSLNFHSKTRDKTRVPWLLESRSGIWSGWWDALLIRLQTKCRSSIHWSWCDHRISTKNRPFFLGFLL